MSNGVKKFNKPYLNPKNNNFSIFPLRQRVKVFTIFRGLLCFKARTMDIQIRKGINQKNMKFWADVADKIYFCLTYSIVKDSNCEKKKPGIWWDQNKIRIEMFVYRLIIIRLS